MKGIILTSAAGVLLLAGAAWALAKDPAAHVSHLQAGTVRYVKGKQLLLAGGQGVPAEIAIGHRLEPGDIVRTGRGDRLEFMLHPGGYLRLADRARLEVLDTAYREMHFRVSEGTFVVDSRRFKSRRHALKLSTPAGDLELLKDGFYRIEVKEPSALEVAVHSGKLNWLKQEGEVLNLTGGKRYVLSSAAENPPAVAELGKHSRDHLDPWGQVRSAFLLNSFWGRPPQYRFAGSNRWLLTAGHKLNAGGRLRTLENGRAELLLNPGSYLRLAESSLVRFIRTGYRKMKFEILQGEIILESAAFNPAIHSLSISTPAGDFQVAARGLYRLSLEPALRVSVYKGALEWMGNHRKRRRLESGRSYQVEAATSKLHSGKLRKKDDLNQWSKERAQQLAKSNSRLSARVRRSAYPSFGYQNRGGWVLGSQGQWFTFVPFDSKPKSPYGFRYRNALWIKSRDLGQKRNGRRQQSVGQDEHDREVQNNSANRAQMGIGRWNN